MNKIDTFLARLPQNAPPHLREDIPVAFGIVDGFAVKVAEIRSDRTLTREGQNLAIAKAMCGPLDHLGQLRAKVDERLNELAAQRVKLRNRVVEAENFTESRKQETRMWLRSLPESERLKLAANNTDPLITESIVGAPHFLSGLNQDLWEHVTSTAVEAAHGEHFEQIDKLETAYLEAAAAMQLVADDMRRVAGFDLRTADAA